jgi:hypothetical protein
MEDSLYMLLTDAEARSAEDVEKRLKNEFTAGAPWFD